MASSAESILPPPSFSLPVENVDDSNLSHTILDENRYELWSIRLPQNIDPTSLNGTTIKLDDMKTNTEKPKYHIQIGNTTMGLVEGNKMDVETIRILLPLDKKLNNNDVASADKKSRIDDDDDDDNDDDDNEVEKTKKSMVPMSQSIQRHFHLVPNLFPPDDQKETLPPPLHVPEGTTIEGVVASLSSSETNENNAIEALKMKIAYSPKDQVSGLKRRWKPLGADTNLSYDASLNQLIVANHESKPKMRNTTSLLSPPSTVSKNKISEKKRAKKQKKEHKKEKKAKKKKKSS